jgi:hypothetical protein
MISVLMNGIGSSATSLTTIATIQISATTTFAAAVAVGDVLVTLARCLHPPRSSCTAPHVRNLGPLYHLAYRSLGLFASLAYSSWLQPSHVYKNPGRDAKTDASITMTKHSQNAPGIPNPLASAKKTVAFLFHRKLFVRLVPRSLHGPSTGGFTRCHPKSLRENRESRRIALKSWTKVRRAKSNVDSTDGIFFLFFIFHLRVM